MKLPQLSLRELFLLVAMGCGWWMRESQMDDAKIRLKTENDSLREELQVNKQFLNRTNHELVEARRLSDIERRQTSP